MYEEKRGGRDRRRVFKIWRAIRRKKIRRTNIRRVSAKPQDVEKRTGQKRRTEQTKR